MAVKTQQELTDEIALNLASASNITASEHRQVAQDIVDTIFSYVRPYKVYTALLTQSGTDAPVATVLENTLGGTVVWTRTAAGRYLGTLAGAFTNNKTWVDIISFNPEAGIYYASIIRGSNDTIQVWIDAIDASPGVDDVLNNKSIEIRVYP